MDSENRYESYIIPFVLRSKADKPFDSLKKVCDEFNSLEFSKLLFEIEKIDEHDKFRNIFETDENEKREQRYFYDEFFRSLYEQNFSECGNCNETSCMYGLKKNEKYVFEEDSDVSIRKAYIFITFTGTGAIVIEGKPNHLLKEDNPTVEKVCELISSKFYEELNLNDNVHILFKDKFFTASFEEKRKRSEKKIEVIDEYHLLGAGNDSDMTEFFSYYLQIYIACIIQKTEILHMSMMANDNSKGSNIKLVKKLDSIFKNYIYFVNRFDFVDCTPDIEGQKIYEELRRVMKIEETQSRVREQIEALDTWSKSKRERSHDVRLNLVSIVLSIAAVIIAAMQIIVAFWLN